MAMQRTGKNVAAKEIRTSSLRLWKRFATFGKSRSKSTKQRGTEEISSSPK